MSKYTIDSSTLTDIADAIRTQTGGSSQITPLEMPTAIGSIESGISNKDFVENVVKALNKQKNDVDNSLNGIVYYPSDNSYFPIITGGQPWIKFKFTGTYSGGFKISVIEYDCYNGYWYTIDYIEQQTSGISVEGFEYPRVATIKEANPTTVGTKGVDISTFEASNHPLYSSPSQIYNLYTARTHPIALNAWGNNKLATLKDITDSPVDIADLFYIDRVPNNFDLDNITQGCIFISGNHLVIDCGPDDGPRVYVDSEGITHSRAGTARHFWGFHNGFLMAYLDAIDNIQLYDNSASGVDYAGDNPAENIVFSTYDLGNGYNANISLEKFKSIFHVS